MAKSNLQNRKYELAKELEEILAMEGKGEVLVLGGNKIPTATDVERIEIILNRIKEKIVKPTQNTPIAPTMASAPKNPTETENEVFRKLLMRIFNPAEFYALEEEKEKMKKTGCTEKTCPNCDCTYCPHCEGEDCPNCGEDDYDDDYDDKGEEYDREELIEQVNELSQQVDELEEENTKLSNKVDELQNRLDAIITFVNDD